MRGSDFPEAVGTLLAPDGLEEEIYGLPVWYHEGCRAYISKWKMSWRERIHCLLFGHVWLHLLGSSHPPVNIETYYPFEPADYSGEGLRRKRMAVIRVLVALFVLMMGVLVGVLGSLVGVAL